MAVRMWRMYQRWLVTDPWKSQTITSGVIVSAGDIISQQVVEKRGLAHHDFKRTLRMATVGLCLGPILRSWYLTLERFVPSTSRPVLDGFKKMLPDQLLFAPCVSVAFFWINNTFAGGTFEELKKKLNERYVETLLNGYKVWPAVQMVNFTIVPFQYRIGVVQLVAVLWNAYLSWQVNKPTSSDKEITG
ncbi:protein Mpv17 [Exaiptasia diaphana]|uniref:Mitochondrial inner membrane protein Mpv17 n=1 Tax=Exaiptasia diaphana TaxID=2652724 RepID=A0A913XG18_EXADI|nr:protein Mpv17 [Exaiptasia diaphana]KXJ12398.1 Protein Mpv17 [Exaiptasia diaphana]